MHRSTFAVLFVCAFASLTTACGGGSSGDEADGGPDATSGVPSICPAVNPKGGACTSPGLGCTYDLDPSSGTPNVRCDCVAPENVWECCAQYTLSCPSEESQYPEAGTPCCVGDVRIQASNPGADDTIGCGICYPGGEEHVIACTSADRHWRASTRPCGPIDGGLSD